jgi:hypothetical protein
VFGEWWKFIEDLRKTITQYRGDKDKVEKKARLEAAALAKAEADAAAKAERQAKGATGGAAGSPDKAGGGGRRGAAPKGAPPKGAPPKGAADGATWLCDAWNEASANIATWPATRALGTVGWRRNKGDGIAGSALASKVLIDELRSLNKKL